MRQAQPGERKRERDREPDDDRDDRELEMLPDAEADLAGVVRDPVPADERLARRHAGVSTRSIAPIFARVSAPR